MNFPENLKKFRNKFGLSQAQIGVICGGYAAPSIWKWEKGVAEPNMESLCILADTFGITVDELIGHEPKSEPMILRKEKEPPESGSKVAVNVPADFVSSVDFEKVFQACVEKVLRQKGMLK